MKEYQKYWSIMEKVQTAYDNHKVAKDKTDTEFREVLLLDAVKELLDYYNRSEYKENNNDDS